jgi:peptide/nickel transport system permease protein
LVLVLLFSISLWLGALAPQVAAAHCPLGRDLVHPDRTVCELAFGGLWVSLGMGAAAAALATALGLSIALLARAVGGAFARLVLGATDAFFSLPDVLILMVLQFAGQSFSDQHPGAHLGSVPLMIASLALVGWAGPARMVRDRLATLEEQDFVLAAKALGGGRRHVLFRHLARFLPDYLLAIFLARIPAAILAESTVSFFGIARVEPMSLGRYLGTSYANLLYPSGIRVVLPAWGLLVLVVLAAAWTARALERRSHPRAAG